MITIMNKKPVKKMMAGFKLVKTADRPFTL